jgi:AraC-like DNA-binding protein
MTTKGRHEPPHDCTDSAEEARRGETAIRVPTAVLDDAGPPLKCNPVTESVTIRRWQSLPGLEVWAVKDSARLFAAYHTTYAFCCSDVPNDSANRWHCGRSVNEMCHADDVMVISPGDTHRTLHITAPTSYHVLIVDPCAIGERQPPFIRNQVNDARLASTMIWLWRALERPNGWDPLECSERFAVMMQAALCHTERTPTVRPPCLLRLEKARRMVEDLYADSFVLNDVAAEVGLNPCHLTRTFHEQYGMPLAKYRRVVRASMALSKLRSSRLVSDVASECGYVDQAHMSNEIRRLFGFTPGKFAGASRG